MAIVGFNFSKISVERKATPSGKVSINNNVAIKNVDKTDLSLGKSKQAGLKFTFEFKVNYEPKIGQIILEGDVLDLEEEKMVTDTVAEWKKSKKIPQGMMRAVLNTILSRSNIQALILSREINLPSPIPLPRVNANIAKPSAAAKQ
jgi:hypothetical protein